VGPPFDGDRAHGDRTHRDPTVPLPAMISGDDLRDARDILDKHRRSGSGPECDCCGAAWPCTEVRYAWMVTGTAPLR
jgi:hypothetical protein